ncbi:hypothetical protein [Paraburkholderia sp. GAS334]|uniref:hypothetical protein n=1 Tax=Paraburkholderia sp. GAS334 TaxID=3035131 RepID=UPI003D242192
MLARDGHHPSQDAIDNYNNTIAADQGHPYPINLSEYFGGMIANQLFKLRKLDLLLQRVAPPY